MEGDTQRLVTGVRKYRAITQIKGSRRERRRRIIARIQIIPSGNGVNRDLHDAIGGRFRIRGVFFQEVRDPRDQDTWFFSCSKIAGAAGRLCIRAQDLEKENKGKRDKKTSYCLPTAKGTKATEEGRGETKLISSPHPKSAKKVHGSPQPATDAEHW